MNISNYFCIIEHRKEWSKSFPSFKFKNWFYYLRKKMNCATIIGYEWMFFDENNDLISG